MTRETVIGATPARFAMSSKFGICVYLIQISVVS
jgi:hypothetical protein